MAVRIRKTGRIFCAALSQEMAGDCYIDDGLHYDLSVERKVLITTENEHHMKNGGEWWWKGQEPAGAPIDEFYYEKPNKEIGKVPITKNRQPQRASTL